MASLTSLLLRQHPLRFLFASKPEAIGPVLVIVQRVIAGWLADQVGVDHASAQCGAVTLIQRFGSALNLNVRKRSTNPILPGLATL